MSLTLVLLWRSVIVERCGSPNMFADNSRFGEFNPD